MKQAETFTATIGIECHVQLSTATKLFAAVGNDARNAEPNTLISPLCVGMPGALPVLNEQAVALSIRAGIALGAEIAEYSKFDRKHYFYPDLPLGYQITQFDEPIILQGLVKAPLDNNRSVSVRVHHAHLEADAGKSTHPPGKLYSLVDLNRAGTPLIEIVSEPDMHTPEEAKAYARELYLLMKYSGVSEADLYYGNMRFDVNVSVSNTNQLGTRTETKNLNSFRSVEKAVEYEIARQTEVLKSGGVIVQETRGWDDDTQVTFSQRSKEDAHDYRYFPDPDLPPIVIQSATVDEIRSAMPAMPGELRQKLSSIGLNFHAIESLLESPQIAGVIEYVTEAHDQRTAKTVANWYTGEIARLLSDEKVSIEQAVASVHRLVELVAMIDGNLLSSTAAKELITPLILSDISAHSLAEEHNLLQVSDESELEMIVQEILSNNQKAVDDIRAGEIKAIGFIVGQTMKASGGKANPSVVQELIKKILGI